MKVLQIIKSILEAWLTFPYQCDNFHIKNYLSLQLSMIGINSTLLKNKSFYKENLVMKKIKILILKFTMKMIAN